MLHVRRAASAAVVFSIWVLGAVVPCRATDAPVLLAELRATYESTTDLSARFVQTSHLVAAGMDREAQGEVVFQKRGKMRWTYEGDDPQVIVSDGETLWIHQIRDRTVLKQKLSEIPASSRLALDLLNGFDGVESSFSVSTCGELCLELTPREPRPDLSRVLVNLASDRQGVQAVTTEDTLGNRTRVEFRAVRRNAGVPRGAFDFEIPRGVQVLDMPGTEP
jgi:outer membrane lipoprotein-sorting protein